MMKDLQNLEVLAPSAYHAEIDSYLSFNRCNTMDMSQKTEIDETAHESSSQNGHKSDGSRKTSNVDLRSVVAWLESQDDTKAHCAKRIIESKSFNNIRFHLSEITDWLASKAHTSKNAGQAYFLVTEIASNISLLSS